MNVNERINRIFAILTYVSQNPGVEVEELAGQVGLRPKQLLREMEFMLLIGKPPFRPDDYVDIYVEDNRVYIEFDQMLNRPLRLTRAEGMALLMALQLLDPEVNPEAVHSLRAKIGDAIAGLLDLQGRLEDRVLLERPSRPILEHFSRLRKAIEERRKLGIQYYSLTRDQTSRRRIRPYCLLKHLGYWYLTGYCEMRQDVRTFKFERILEVESLPDFFPPPQDFDAEKYRQDFLKSMGGNQVSILFDESVAPRIREQWGSSVVDQPDGAGTVLTFSSETLEYPSRLVLQYAPHAHPLSPPELVDKLRQDAQSICEVYQSRATS